MPYYTANVSHFHKRPDWYQIAGSTRSNSGRTGDQDRRKLCKGTHRTRVWSINHVVPVDRWTLGSMETPHNWENSAGLLVERAQGHLSCRDRERLSTVWLSRFKLTPVKSRVVRSGKSALFDLWRLEVAHRAHYNRYRVSTLHMYMYKFQ